MRKRPWTVITISGFTGAGKTTISKILSEELSYEYVSGSSMRAHFFSIDAPNRTVWLSDAQAISLEEQRLTDAAAEERFDKYLDELHFSASNCVFDVWFLPWYCTRRSVHVWLDVPFADRINRVAAELGEAASTSELKASIMAKDRRAASYALRQFGVDIYTDRSPFDLVLGTSENSSPVALVQNIITFLVSNQHVEG